MDPKIEYNWEDYQTPECKTNLPQILANDYIINLFVRMCPHCGKKDKLRDYIQEGVLRDECLDCHPG